MKRTLAFAKGSEELSSVKVDFLHISKCSFLEKKKKKKTFKTFPNAHFIFLVSKRAFCHLKVQTNGHEISLEFYEHHFLPSKSTNKRARSFSRIL